MRLIEQEAVITQKIFLIRSRRVMLDRDLAEIYGVETRELNQAVKRNSMRFPNDFMFALTREEIMRISQIVISLKYSKSVNVFTEQGIAMLSSVLNSERAILANIQIMRVFVKIKELVLTHHELAKKIDELERKFKDHDEKLSMVFEAIKQLLAQPVEPAKPKIGFHAD